MSNTNNNIIDININGIQKKRYRINGDDSKILELNPTDFNITVRLNSAYPKLKDCEARVKELKAEESDTDTESNIASLSDFANKLSKLNTEMCELMDYIFNANVSEVCCDGGSMYDPMNGYMRYEIIIDNLTDLYEKNLTAETKKIQRRVKQRTAKYTKK